MKFLHCLVCIVALSGCAGTIATRFENGKNDCFGRYPFQAVAYDFTIIGPDSPVSLVGVISMPFDLIGDVIGLPFDLIFWPFGFKRDDE